MSKVFWLLFADVLWWCHFVIVILVVFGFFAQFFVPKFTFFELILIGIVMVSQFIWFGKCPSTELESYFRKKADLNYKTQENGCISDAIFVLLKIRVSGKWISVAGVSMLILTVILYIS